MTDLEFNKEWEIFYNNLKFAELDKFFDIETLSKSLRVATCGTNIDTGCAYEGSLIVHINLLVGISRRIMKMVSNTLPVNEISLVKVCLLQHLSKINMFIPNDNDWERNKRGIIFKFADLPGKLKLGERSILMAINKGIQFSPIEWEAMNSFENIKENDLSVINILTLIVKQGNELAYAIEQERAKKIS